MADTLETLDATASEDTLEQPVEQAEVEATEAVVSEEAPEGADSATATESNEQPGPSGESRRKYADKYDTDVELERAYREQNAEASRMAARLAQLEREVGQRSAPKDAAPKYSPDQLETWKETRIQEVAQFQAMAARLQAEGNWQEAQKYQAEAANSARQIRFIDAELRQHDIQATLGKQTSTEAKARLEQQALGIVKQYVSDLVPGNPLYEKSNEFLSGYGAMGLDVQSPLVQAQSVAMAAQALGLSSKKVEQSTRKELTKTITKALKDGVTVGAGKSSSKAGAYPDFVNMSDDDFIAWKAKRGLGH